MSNLIVDGFAHYGTNAVNGQNAVNQAMLSGAWATLGGGFTGIEKLPWDLSNDDLYAKFAFLGPAATRALPASIAQTAPLFASFYFATSALPGDDAERLIFDVRDGANAIIGNLRLRPTGALVWTNTSGSTHQSSGPVVVAQTITHMELRYVPGTGANGTITVKANGVSVITATGMSVPAHAAMEIFALGHNGVGSVSAAYYVSHLIVRDSAGSFNNDFMGDRKVATLIVNGNDPDNQGWADQPLHRFGNGVLKVGPASAPGGATTTNAGVFAGVTTETNMGNLDYCIEGQFRFQRLPSGTDKAVLFGKWDEPANQRSYQVFLGGPSLNNGDLVFRTSSDGTAATVVNKISYPWSPIVGVWYHVCLERDSGVTTVYIDGVPLGTGVADATTYFAGSARTALGVETSTASGVVNTALAGWNDEYRMTKGATRYGGPFTPPSAPFPRGPVDDPDWSDVVWLSGWDSASVADESGFARPLSAINSAAAITPNDGGFAYQTINKNFANDDTFIEAAFLFASGIYTQTANPANNETVTVGTTDGSTAAAYTFKTALSGGTGNPYEVLIGATLLDTLENLVNAIIAGSGSGTTYGDGTVANFDVTAEQLPINQIQATALYAGTAGNAIAVSDTASNGTWGSGVTTLSGGEDLPDFSQFVTQHLPAGASIVDSVTIVRRSWKTDAGACQARVSFVGPADGVLNGDTINESTAPTLYADTFEEDPDNPGNPLSPTAILQGRLRIDRTG